MTKSRKLCLALAVALSCGASMANGQDRLVVYMNNGAQNQAFSLTEVKKLTFSDGGNLVVTTFADAPEIALTDIRSIKFDDNTSTGVTEKEVSGNVTFKVVDNQVVVTGWQGATGVTIFDIMGRVVYSNGAWNGEPVSVAQLSHGVYIFKTSTKTFKFSK